MNDLSPVSLKRSGGSEPAAPCPLPLSFAQERLWFLEQLEPGNVAYLIPHSLRFAVALDARTLEWSLNEILRRHEVLRTRFAAIDGEPAQFVLPWLELELRIEDLEREERRDAAIARCAREEWSKPFELDRPPLLRARLLRLAESDWLLLVTIHHLVADGWSVGLFERELTALYDARLGRTPPPPPLRLQYADFALWQRQRFEGAELERQLGYWREQLDGAPELLALPTDRARTADRTLRGGTLGFVVAAEALDRLRALGRQGGVTLFMVLTGALAVLLGRAAREDEVVLGTPIAGRLNSEIERLIGLFANTLALRVQLGGDPTVRELLVRVRNTCLAAYEHQELPFERLVEELRPRRDLGHNPIFQVMFTLQNLPTRGAQAAHGQTGELVAAGQGSAKFDLSFSVAESADGLAGALEYSSDLFDTATVERLAEHWVTLLEHFAAGVDRPLGKLSLLREEERRQVVDGWNQTTFDHVELPLDEWFEQTVERSGDAIAVQYGSRELSYRDLDARSNRLAHRLRASGVGPEVRVALCLERSIDLVVALLAVTKAGGAYVPLDPSYPRERLKFMLRDSGARVVLTVRSLAATLPSLAAETIHLDDADELLGLPSTPPERLLE